MVLDKENFINFVNHKSYGVFEDDYTVTVLGFHINFKDDTSAYRAPDSPIKKASYAEALKKGAENNLTIMVRKGSNPTDQPARGLHTFNILSDMNEILRVLNHFNINGKVSKVSRATPSLPSLEILLTSTLLQLMNDGIITKEPLMIYKPTPQSEQTGCTELWAHAETIQGTSPKRVIIEGAGGRVDKEELKHELSFSGEVLGELIPQTWTNEGPLAGVLNGDFVAHMRLDLEVNWVFVNNHAFKCVYNGQSMQCTFCYSWEHRAGVCERRGESRRDLQHQYQSKWRRQVAYTARGVMEVPSTPTTDTATATPTAIHTVIAPSTGATTPTGTSNTPKTSGTAAGHKPEVPSTPTTDTATATPTAIHTVIAPSTGATTPTGTSNTPKTSGTATGHKPVLKFSDKAPTPKENENANEAGKIPGIPKRSDSKNKPKPPNRNKTPAGQDLVDSKKLSYDTASKPSYTAKPQKFKEDTPTEKDGKPPESPKKPTKPNSDSPTKPSNETTKTPITDDTKPADTESKPTETAADNPRTTAKYLDKETEYGLEIDLDKDDRDPTKILSEYERKYNNDEIEEIETLDDKANQDKKRKRKEETTTPNKATEEEKAKKKPANPPSPKESKEPGEHPKKRKEDVVSPKKGQSRSNIKPEEKERSMFQAELQKIKDEVSKKDLPAVKRTAARKTFAVLLEKMKEKTLRKDGNKEVYEPDDLERSVEEVRALLDMK